MKTAKILMILLLLSLLTVAVATTAVAAPLAQGGGHGGGGGGGHEEPETTASNNLSYPVIWSEGISKTLTGSWGMTPTLNGVFWYQWGTNGADPDIVPASCLPDPDETNALLNPTGTPFCDDNIVDSLALPAGVPAADNPLPLARAYLQKDEDNIWRAWDGLAATAGVSNTSGGVDIDWIDWGDNLESVDWYTRSQVRTEVVLFKEVLVPLLEYEMRHTSGWGIDEVHGLATDLSMTPLLGPGTSATVFSPCARLTIQKLLVPRDDIRLADLIWVPGVGWTEPAGYLDNLINPAIFNGAVHEAADGTGYYNAEINVKGRIIYGYTWNVRTLNDMTPVANSTIATAAGDYRITFSFDQQCGTATLKTYFIQDTTQITVPVEVEEIIEPAAEDDSAGAVAVLLPAQFDGSGALTGGNLTYMDVHILPRGGSSGGGRVEISATPSQALPGTTTTYPLTVTNTGTSIDTFSLSVAENPLGWPVQLGLQASSTTPLQITLDPGEETVIELQVTVPTTVTGGTTDQIVLWLQSQDLDGVVDTAVLNVVAASIAEVQLIPDNSNEATAGSQIAYMHTLTNAGNFADTISLSAVSSEGWSVAVAPAVATLAPGTSTNVSVIVTIPGDAGGEIDVTTLTATSSVAEGITTASVTNTTTATVPRTVGVQLSLGTAVTVYPSEMVSLTHRVTNTGNAPDVVMLTYAAPAEWTITGPISVALDAGQGMEIVIEVTPPISAAGQLRQATVTATSTANHGVATTVQNSIQVANVAQQSVGVQLSLGTAVTVYPGETVSLTHRLTNTGNAPDVMMLTYAAPAEWTITGPISVALDAGQGIEIVVEVTPPISAAGQLRQATVTATSTANHGVATTVQNSIQVASVGMQLLQNHIGYALPGETVVYSHTLVNTGTSMDTFTLSYASSAGWQVSGPAQVQVAAGAVQVIEVKVTMPEQDETLWDVATITATSMRDPQCQATVTNRTRGMHHQAYMPEIERDEVFLPMR